jgi:hypothetical protein
METEVHQNGQPDADGHQPLVLELSVAEAQALKGWLLKAQADGVAAIDDEELKPTLVKLGGLLDYAEGVTEVRRELEAAGFETANLNDEQVAELGRRIADSPIRRVH